MLQLHRCSGVDVGLNVDFLNIHFDDALLRRVKLMKDSSASTWGYVFTVLSAGSGLLAVVAIPVAGTGAPFVVGSLSLVLAVVAALFSERVSHGRFTSLGAFLAVAIAAVAILLFALGRVAWSQGPSESWIRASRSHPIVIWNGQRWASGWLGRGRSCA
jgi:hypothetical protein